MKYEASFLCGRRSVRLRSNIIKNRSASYEYLERRYFRPLTFPPSHLGTLTAWELGHTGSPGRVAQYLHPAGDCIDTSLQPFPIHDARYFQLFVSGLRSQDESISTLPSSSSGPSLQDIQVKMIKQNKPV